MRSILTFTCTLILLPWLAWADLPGDQDRRYQNTLTDWLSGEDDLAALRNFAALSASGNSAAQITLGLIDQRPEMHHHVTQGLPEHRSIFRRSDGRIGTRWMNIAAASHPLAALLADVSEQDYEARAMELADAGVIWSAMRTAQLPFNNGNPLGTIRVLSHKNLLPYSKLDLLSYGNILERGSLLNGDSETAHEVAKLLLEVPPLSFQERLLTWEAADHIETEDLADAEDALRLRGAALLLHPDLGPLIAMMHDLCPSDTAYHTGLLFHVGGSSSLRLALISPLEPIVSSKEWQKSGRFKHDFFRVWGANHDRRLEMAKLSGCLDRADPIAK